MGSFDMDPIHVERLRQNSPGYGGKLGPLAALALLLACSSLAVACEAGKSEKGAGILKVWCHSGRAEEREVIRRLVQEFNESSADLRVSLTIIPEGSYNGQVQAAALAGDLPDVLELDGPFVAGYAWRGYIAAIGERVGGELREDLLSSIVEQGTWGGELYSLAMFDSGLGLYARRGELEQAGARIPASAGEAWTISEFEALLENLAARDEDGAVLDLKLNYRGEWYTYAFSPAIQSAGGDLIGRGEGGKARGVLDGPQSVRVLRRFQSWFEKGRVDPNLDDRAFVAGRATLSWAGHWEYARYKQASGEDLVVLPLPDFGDGSRTGQGSWVWSVTTSCERPAEAMRFLRFLAEPGSILSMCAANGAVPATHTALRRSELYRDDGPLRLFSAQLTGGWSVPRPETPAYPVISSVFEEAFQRIRDGADVTRTLCEAAAVIDREVRDNRGYPER